MLLNPLHWLLLRFFPNLVQSGDKNLLKLIKLYQWGHVGTPSKVKLYLEKFNPATKGKFNDSFIEFHFEEDGNKVGKVLFIDKEEGFVIASELVKILLTLNLKDSFFRVEEANHTFRIPLDNVKGVFGSVSGRGKLFLSELTIKLKLPFKPTPFCCFHLKNKAFSKQSAWRYSADTVPTLWRHFVLTKPSLWLFIYLGRTVMSRTSSFHTLSTKESGVRSSKRSFALTFLVLLWN